MQIGVAVVAFNEGVLVGVRSAESTLAGMHEFPGGKCLLGESAAECAIRETREETGLSVTVVELLDQNTTDYNHGSVDLSFFLCSVVGDFIDPAPPWRWVPIDKLPELNFPAGNRSVIDLLMSRSW